MAVVTDPAILAQLNASAPAPAAPGTQKVTDPAILAQLNGAPPAATPPQGLPAPGSREYADWARNQAVAGATLPQVSPTPTPSPLEAASQDPNALGPNERRGELAPMIRNTQTGAMRLGWPQIALDVGNALTLPGDVASGAAPIDIQNGVLPNSTLGRGLTLSTIAGSELPLASRGMAEAIPNSMATAAAQKSAINSAIKDAPSAADLKGAASQAFQAATDNNPLQITDNAYFRMLGDVKQTADKLRINPDNDPQSTGLLNVMMRIADDTNNGVAVDMKDLHLVRQLAQKVGQSPSGRDQLFGGSVANSMDNFISGLKPADILNSADPTTAANNLMTGIAGWSRGIKTGIIENAVQKADTYQSGMVSGLKQSFSNLMRSSDYARFSPVEQQAIRDVAKGTNTQNTLDMIGKMGFSPGGSGAHNIIGGTIGMGLSSAALTPILGPIAGPAVGTGASMALSAGARAAAERLALSNADRAARIVATPNIPVVAPVPWSPALTDATNAAQLLSRTGVLAAGQRNGGGGGGF